MIFLYIIGCIIVAGTAISMILVHFHDLRQERYAWRQNEAHKKKRIAAQAAKTKRVILLSAPVTLLWPVVLAAFILGVGPFFLLRKAYRGWQRLNADIVGA